MRSISNNRPTSLLTWANEKAYKCAGVRVTSRRPSLWSYLVGCLLIIVCPPVCAEERLEVGQHFRDCPVCPEMVVIPAGKITVELSHGPGQIISTYTLHISRNFAIAVHETRLADWENCEFDGVCGQVILNSSSNKTDFGWREWKGTRPVGNVTWSESLSYAIWLSSRTGKKYWLPSEVEWEYAARGGGTEERPWVGLKEFSCKFSNLGDHDECSDRYKAASPVGSYGANRYGLYDMIGNVSEWTTSCSGDMLVNSSDYSLVLGRDFFAENIKLLDLGRDMIGCNAMVYRGGAWSSKVGEVGFSFRDTLPRGETLETLGFRVVRSIQ